MPSPSLQDLPGTLYKKDNILLLLTGCFAATIYLPGMPVLNNIFIGILVFYSFFYNSFREKMQLLRERSAVQWMFVFFILHIISFFLSQNRNEAGALLRMRMPLLLFPMSLGLLIIGERVKRGVLMVFVVATVLAASFCLITSLSLYINSGDASLLYNDSLSNHIRMQSIYFSLLINVAIAGIVWLLYGNNNHSRIKYAGLLYCFLPLLLLVHFMLASRIGIIILYSGGIVMAFYYVIKKRKVLEGVTLVMGLGIGLFLMVKFFPKTINRFREMGYTSYRYDSKAAESHYNMEVTSEQWNGANIRLAIWKCGWELAGQNIFTGAQLGDKQDKLQEVYRSKGFEFALKSRRNMHNTYLDVLCTFGVIGVFVFLLGYIILPLVRCVRDHNLPGIFIILVFTFSMITEAYLDRSLGSLILVFFITFILASSKKKLV